MATNAPQTSASSSSSSYVPIPMTAAAGGILMTKPQQTATSYYKIGPGQAITFGWNMTSVLAMPTHLTISAVCRNGNTYPVGPTDGIIPATQTEVVWDLYAYQTNNPNKPLAPEMYTLNIWDERGPDAARKGGYLVPYSGLQFALYTPAPYTPLASGWTCATCSGSAMSYVAHPAFVSLAVTLSIILFSGLHLLRNRTRAA